MSTALPSQYVITTDDVAQATAPRRTGGDPSDRSAERLESALARLALRMIESRSVDEAARLAAMGLVELLGGGRVALAVVRPGGTNCKLCVLSSVPSIDHRSERAQALQATLDEVLLNDSPTVVAIDTRLSLRDNACLPLKSHEHLAKITGSRTVLGLPLKSGGPTTGALVWFDEGRTSDPAAVQSVLVRAAEFLGPALQSVVRAERSAFGRVADRCREAVEGQRGRKGFVAAVALLCLLLVPLPYRVTCSARLEPTARRYVVAPFEAVLEATLVRPGDVVQQNEVVALLDGREVRWRLASVEAKLAQAIKRHDAGLAELKPAEAELARLEAEQLRLERRQLESQKEKLQIRSPVRGIVLSGELERAEGAALTTGQTLFEIAPLDELLVELEVPDNQLRFVREGRDVSLKLDAFPGQKWRGTVERVRPQGELRDQQNVFVAELSLENAAGELRPGMDGRAKITGPIRPLAWILFHRPYEALRQWTGW